MLVATEVRTSKPCRLMSKGYFGMTPSTLVIFAVVGICSATILGSKKETTPKREGFKYLAVTLPSELSLLNIWRAKSYWFNKVPLTEADALKQKWTRLNGSDCRNDGRYFGVRYLPKDEKSIAALYDSNGVIAGIQAMYRVQNILNGSDDYGCGTLKKGANNYKFDDQPMINRETINGVQYFVLTAYFTDPKKICNSCRDPSKVTTEGFGHSVYFQNGETPCEVIRAPQNRSLANSKGWSNNKCLPLNGHHNFYRTEDWDKDNCTSFRPSWLFYDGNYELSGFGFTLPGCDGSWRFQHPGGLVTNYVVNSQCYKKISDTIKVSNINVYLKKPVATMLDCVDKTGFISKIIDFFTP